MAGAHKGLSMLSCCLLFEGQVTSRLSQRFCDVTRGAALARGIPAAFRGALSGEGRGAFPLERSYIAVACGLWAVGLGFGLRGFRGFWQIILEWTSSCTKRFRTSCSLQVRAQTDFDKYGSVSPAVVFMELPACSTFRGRRRSCCQQPLHQMVPEACSRPDRISSLRSRRRCDSSAHCCLFWQRDLDCSIVNPPLRTLTVQATNARSSLSPSCARFVLPPERVHTIAAKRSARSD